MEVDTVDTETQLITYIQNILKYQIIPMNFMNLRELIQEAPAKLKLSEYVEENYPDVRFMDFLTKYPHIFTLNPNRTVILTEGNAFTLSYAQNRSVEGCDEVDAPYDKKEYISDSGGSDSEADEALNEESHLLLGVDNSPERRGNDRRVTATDTSSSSASDDSSVDVFSSEIVQTSDSMASSLSSNSSLEN